MRRAASTLLIACLLAGCGSESDDESLPSRATPFDAERAFADLEAQVAIGPRPSGSAGARATAKLISQRLTEAGVLEVGVQRPYANVVGRIEGSEPGAVVVGAHYDTKDGIPRFEGANDGASGVAVLLELARDLPLRVDGPSIHLAFFDAEEARGSRPFELDGTRGSRQYVAYARRGGSAGLAAAGRDPRDGPLRPRRRLRAADPARGRTPTPASMRSLPTRPRSAPAARRRSRARPPPVGDDHLPFLEAGVPAVDLIDFEYGPGPAPGAYWHTPEDTLDKVCAESLDAVGEAALRAIPQIR